MAHPYKGFEPKWFQGEIPKDSYRSIFKWGVPEQIKAPRENMLHDVLHRFGMDDTIFHEYQQNLGLDPVKVEIPVRLAKEHIDALKAIVGEENVRTDDYARFSVAYGKTMYDLLRARSKIVENVPDVVVYPASKEQIEAIVAYVSQHKIPLYVYGGGSSVTRGVECVKGGISLDMRLNFNKVVSFNEADQMITVEAGMSGPALEDWLNNAPEKLGAKRRYTLGHFPQSFEHSSVGGWVVTHGSGQNSTYYGCIQDLVLGQSYATPRGVITTDTHPRKATGPDLDQIMMGAEGAFGVLTHVSLKLSRHMPETTRRFSYMFKDWQTGIAAAKEIMQSEAGKPSVFRLSDPEETSIMLNMYGVMDTPLKHLFALKGMKMNEMCLFLGFTNGAESYSKCTAKNVAHVARQFGGLPLTGYVCKGWEHGRFSDPYLRDTLQDFGVLMDTMECCVNWSEMERVHAAVRKVVKARPNTICMTHMSHVYPQGGNLYWIYIILENDAEEFRKFHASILDAIQKNGASMSHHHGIGKMFGPWLEGQLGGNEYAVIRALKEYFDPDYIMNPGGTLGLDIPEAEKRKLKGNDPK
ncbi:MAG: FAD-binding oxidoreductase [Oscillospiraceae bacterium]|jgi:alkyldihydroxyacetonephosphate synthase|nr:FAD-binding oxidoreductase [Oscillospiraceae bacterium]